jgi:hypothetical protein
VYDRRQSKEEVSMIAVRRSLRRVALPLAALAVIILLPAAVQAQPFGAWLVHNGTGTGRIDIAHHPSLNPTAAFTFEAWVSVSTGGNCQSIAGKGFTDTWWVGICGTTLRSYLKGNPSLRDGGVVPAGRWTHLAVVFNGTQRRHYINGELVGTFPETGPLPTNTDPMRIASDVDFAVPPNGAIDEVRLWNVARTEAQLRAAINVPITTAQPGLVAVWSLDGNASDIIGARDGTVSGTGIGALTFPVALSCGASTATSLCLLNRFSISARFRTGAPGSAESTAQVVNVPNPGSGLFWFFNADNWEVLVKAINGCGLNNRYWIFSAATTNVFYRVEVLDVRGAQKIYFNYPGPPAPAVTDTSAFATCP